ncbi:MAG: hypothetical protein R3286_10715 [Gammaproteobacteria bacterium]|nr:hypothetical protein [Gammaproteobacteria bacterium]
MPYYVYEIHPARRLEYVDEFEAYRDARVLARGMRKALTPADEHSVRIIFAPGREQAERLLREVREARPLGEDA